MCLIFLVALSFSGTAYVRCLGDNGHIEFEANYIPCCDEVAESCKINIPDESHSEHSDCFNCLDIELNNLFLSNRIQNIDSNHLANVALVFIAEAPSGSISIDSDILQNVVFQLAGNQDPPFYSMALTVLRC